MSRKKVYETITAEGRDNGKLFVIEEMSAFDGEWWATRAAAGIIKVNPDIANLAGSGMQFIAIAGIQGLLKLPADEFFGLGNDLISTIRRARDPNHRDTLSTLIEGDIEEVQTRLHLKMVALELNLGFSIAELLSKLTSDSAQKTSPPGSSVIQTSQE